MAKQKTPAPFNKGDQVVRHVGCTVFTITQIRKRPGRPDQWQVKVKNNTTGEGGGKWDWWDFASYYKLANQ